MWCVFDPPFPKVVRSPFTRLARSSLPQPYDDDDPAAASAMKDAVAQVKAARFKAGRK